MSWNQWVLGYEFRNQKQVDRLPGMLKLSFAHPNWAITPSTGGGDHGREKMPVVHYVATSADNSSGYGLHPDLSTEQRVRIDEKLGTCDDVVSAYFSPVHMHEYIVAYDPEAIDLQTIMGQVRQWDAAATMVGL